MSVTVSVSRSGSRSVRLVRLSASLFSMLILDFVAVKIVVKGVAVVGMIVAMLPNVGLETSFVFCDEHTL